MLALGMLLLPPLLAMGTLSTVGRFLRVSFCSVASLQSWHSKSWLGFRLKEKDGLVVYLPVFYAAMATFALRNDVVT